MTRMLFSQRFILIAACSFLFSISLQAQKPPMKWGRIDDSHLQLASYEPDTAASALILCDFATLTVDLGDGDLRYVLEHHQRVKILKRSGFDYADVAIPFHEGQEVKNIKAQLFTPDGQAHEVKKSDIFKERNQRRLVTSEVYLSTGDRRGGIGISVSP